MTAVDTYISWAFFIAMGAPVVFVVVYLTMTWWKTWEGRVIMAQKLLFCGFLTNGVLYYWLGPDFAARDLVRIVLFTAMPIILWSMTILLIRAKLESGKLKERNPDDAVFELEKHRFDGDTNPELVSET